MTTVKAFDESTQRDAMETESHRVVVMGPQAERAGEVVRKGMPVKVLGRLKWMEWGDVEGRCWSETVVVAEAVHVELPLGGWVANGLVGEAMSIPIENLLAIGRSGDG